MFDRFHLSQVSELGMLVSKLADIDVLFKIYRTVISISLQVFGLQLEMQAQSKDNHHAGEAGAKRAAKGVEWSNEMPVKVLVHSRKKLKKLTHLIKEIRRCSQRSCTVQR